MKIFRDLENIRIPRPVGTIGIFDGVHLAHQAVIRKLELKAGELQGESTIITLWPHPRIVLQKDLESLQLLNTMEEKIHRLEEAGVENLIIIPFDKRFAQTNFTDFVQTVLVKKLGIAHLVVGFDHQFGRDRDGNFEKLQKLSSKLGFGLSQQEPIIINDEKVSSSGIRKYILEGNVRKALQLLGYGYCLHGRVVSGNQKGRQIGFPTANISVSEPYKLIPVKGVYAVIARVHNKAYKAMMNIGCRPTLNENCEESVLEAHLFDYSGDLYNEEIEIEFIDRVRDEKKFESVDLLKSQISNDRELINKILTSIKL